MYDGFNICELAKLDKLSQFKVKDLKEMCNFFELSPKARDTKFLLIERIKRMVKECYALDWTVERYRKSRFALTPYLHLEKTGYPWTLLITTKLVIALYVS